MSATPIAPAQLHGERRMLVIPLDMIEPDRNQPRRHFDTPDLNELAKSIKEVGLLQPITVRPMKGQGANPRYQIVAGERRYLASKKAGLDTISVIVHDDLKDKDVSLIQLLENLLRVDLKASELIAGVQSLAERMPAKDIAAQLGKDRAWVSRHATVHKLWAPAAKLAMEDLCSVDLAHELATLHDVHPARAQQLAEMIRTPPKHRGAVTRDEVRSHIDMAKRLASEEAKAKDAKAKREIAADNQRGYTSTAGESVTGGGSPRDTKPLDREEDTANDKGKTPDLGESPQAGATPAQPKPSHPLQAWAETSARQIEDLLARKLGLTADAQGYWQKADGTDVTFNVWPMLITEDNRPIEKQEDVLYDFELRGLLRSDLEQLAGGQATEASQGGPVLREDERTVQEFFGDYCVTREGDRIMASYLYERYLEWCQKSGAVPMNNNGFAATLALLGVKKHRYNSGVHYLDIGPKEVE